MSFDKRKKTAEEVVGNYTADGKIVSISGGLYKIRLDRDGKNVFCRARGAFRHSGMTPLVGDNVVLRCDKPEDELTGGETDGGIMIESVKERKNALIRPPMANLDCIFVSMAAAAPSPILATVDKLIAIAEHNSIEPYVVVGKSELDAQTAKKITDIYSLAGFKVFSVSAFARM